MELNKFTKEQKQYVIFSVLGLILVVGLAAFAVYINLSSVAQAKAELFDLKGKIERADSALSKDSEISEEYARTVMLLKDYLKNLPPERNYYAWATEFLYRMGRSMSMDIDSVDELAELHAKGAADNKEIGFQAYSLRIRGRGGYANIKAFIREISEEHPLIRVTGVEISSGKNSDIHEVQLFVQWPFSLGEIERLWEEIESKQKNVSMRLVEMRRQAIEAPAGYPDKTEAEPSNTDQSRYAAGHPKSTRVSAVIL